MDTIQNFVAQYSINQDLNLVKLSSSPSDKKNEKIIEQFDYDFNFDHQIDRVQLVKENKKENNIKIIFYQNKSNVYTQVYESTVPHQHVYFEKEKSIQSKGLAISLVEKQQSITEYITYDQRDKKFKVTEICHSINETTPVGYQLKEQCKKTNKNISDLDFITALEIVE